MGFPFLPVVLGLIAAAAILFYLFYKPQQKPHTDTLYTDALNAMVKADKATAITL